MTSAIQAAALPAAATAPGAPPLWDPLPAPSNPIRQATELLDGATGELQLAEEMRGYADAAATSGDQVHAQLYTLLLAEHLKVARTRAREAIAGGFGGLSPKESEPILRRQSALMSRIDGLEFRPTRFAPVVASFGHRQTIDVLRNVIDLGATSTSAKRSAAYARSQWLAGDRSSAYNNLADARYQISRAGERLSALSAALGDAIQLPASADRDRLVTLLRSSYVAARREVVTARREINAAADVISSSAVSDGWNGVWSLYRSASAALEHVAAHDRAMSIVQRKYGNQVPPPWDPWVAAARYHAEQARSQMNHVEASQAALRDMAKALPAVQVLGSWHDYGNRVIDFIRSDIDRVSPRIEIRWNMDPQGRAAA